MNGDEPRRQGERHRDALFDKARLECEVLDYLEQHGPVDVATIAAAFGLPVIEAGRLVENFRLAEIVIAFPTMLRATAKDLGEQEPRLAATILQVAKEWDDGDLGTNIARLSGVLAYSDKLTEAQIERLGRAKRELQERKEG